MYRPEDDDIPLSRRPRERLELRADGSAHVFGGGPDDRLDRASRRRGREEATASVVHPTRAPGRRVVADVVAATVVHARRGTRWREDARDDDRQRVRDQRARRAAGARPAVPARRRARRCRGRCGSTRSIRRCRIASAASRRCSVPYEKLEPGPVGSLFESRLRAAPRRRSRPSRSTSTTRTCCSRAASRRRRRTGASTCRWSTPSAA